MTRPYDYTSEADVMTLFQRQHGVCASKGCEAKLRLDRPRNFIIEHDTALGRHGSNELKNKSLRCKPCANRKTFGNGATTKGSDIFEIAKEKRVAGVVWCVRHRDGWCAAVPNKSFPDTQDNVKTKCGMWVTLPGGCEHRVPDCPECLAASDQKFTITKPPIGGEGPREHGGEPIKPDAARSRWPSPKLQSRGFSDQHRPMNWRKQTQKETT